MIDAIQMTGVLNGDYWVAFVLDNNLILDCQTIRIKGGHMLWVDRNYSRAAFGLDRLHAEVVLVPARSK